MEISVKRNVLVDIVEKTAAILSAKPAITTLRGILLEARKNGGILLTATDLENTVRAFCDSDVIKEGVTLVPGKQFMSLIRQIPDETIRLGLTGNKLRIQTEKSNYHFLVMNHEEFPKLPKFSGVSTFKIDAVALREAVDRVKNCIYAEDPRPHFRGGLLEVKDRRLFLVATDTKRLALVEKPLEAVPAETAARCLLTHRLLSFLSGVLEKGEIEVSISSNQISFKTEQITVISQLLEGSQDFPDYAKVIPDESKANIVLLDTRLLEAALKRLSLFTSERYNRVRISFVKQKVSISVNSPEVGEAQEFLEVDYKGELQEIAFNPEYLLDFLQRVQDKNISFAFTNDKRPVLLRPEKEREYTYVAMPLKLE